MTARHRSRQDRLRQDALRQDALRQDALRQDGQQEHDRADRQEAVMRSFVIADQAIQGSRLAPGLYLVATPIGNLGDITLRALQALAGADLIACEDTRVTRKLLDRYAVATPLTPYHDHNAAKARPGLLRRLAEGAAIALVSDAGTPLISDPGYKLVRAAQDAGHLVTALPGASAVLAALTVAGLPTDRFFFAGFLPPKQMARRARIAELASLPATLVLFESGPRIAATLGDLAAGLGANRQAALCRELTKLHEEIRRGELASLAQACACEELRGEIVVVIASPQGPVEMAAAESEELLRDALARLSLKDAVAEIAQLTGKPRREIYQSALALQKSAKKDAKHGAPR
jgi:16S rRNA (cytidine1402-2'-O)-methyltransferase